MKKLYEMGTVYFIKDGKITDRKLYTTSDELTRGAETLSRSGTISMLALEEQQQIKNMLPRNTYLKVYKQFLEDDYTVIRVDNNFYVDVDDNNKITNITYADKKINTFVPLNVDQKSSELIMKIYNLAVKDTDIYNRYIYNVTNHNGELDYDYLSYSQLNSNYSMSDYLDVLLREKTNSLTEEEIVMFDEYRNYDLKSILTKNYLDKKISHLNAGTIVITPNNTQERTSKKMQHGDEICWSLYKDGLISYDDHNSLWELSEKTNSIIIQLCLGEAIIWLNPNEKRTPYQQMELNRIIHSIENIKKEGYDVDISAAICENSFFRSIEADEILVNDQNSDNQKRTNL